MVAHHERHESLFLMGPGLDAARGGPAKEAVEGRLGVEPRLGCGRVGALGLPPRWREPAEGTVREGVGSAGLGSRVGQRDGVVRIVSHGH